MKSALGPNEIECSCCRERWLSHFSFEHIDKTAYWLIVPTILCTFSKNYTGICSTWVSPWETLRLAIRPFCDICSSGYIFFWSRLLDSWDVIRPATVFSSLLCKYGRTNSSSLGSKSKPTPAESIGSIGKRHRFWCSAHVLFATTPAPRTPVPAPAATLPPLCAAAGPWAASRCTEGKEPWAFGKIWVTSYRPSKYLQQIANMCRHILKLYEIMV